jgi:hypothetical protein
MANDEFLTIGTNYWVAVIVVLVTLMFLMMIGVLGNKLVVAAHLQTPEVKLGTDGKPVTSPFDGGLYNYGNNPSAYFNTTLTGTTGSQSSPGPFPYSTPKTSGFEQPSFWVSDVEINDNQHASVLTAANGMSEGMRVKENFSEKALAKTAYGGY